MKEHDLRQALDQIRPDETLIHTTIEKVHAQQYKNAVKRAENSAKSFGRSPAFRYAFAARLASATCALLLVIGMGIAVGKNAAPTTSNRQDYTRTQFNDIPHEREDAVSFNSHDDQEQRPVVGEYPTEQRDRLLARAEQSEGEWFLLDAELSACYILPDEDSDSAECLVAFDQIQVLSAESDAAVDQFLQDAPTVRVTLADADACAALADRLGSRICVLVFSDSNGYTMDSDYILAE